MQNIDVVYLYEHAARELDVACAVSAILEHDHHLSVDIVQWPTGFPAIVAKIRPRLVMLPFCYSEQSFRNLLVFWRESLFLNLSWEQLFYLGNQTAKTPRGDFSLNHVFHHTWSEEYAGFLRGAGIPQGHIFVNGQPAYALYNEPYRRYFASRQDLANRYDLGNSRPWLFFPENYNWAFYSHQTIKGFIEKGQSPGDIQVMRDYCERSLDEMLRWCADAAEQLDVDIILRPRPSTSMEEFLDFANKVRVKLPARLHIIQQGSVREWILASDMIISSHSTSLIEAVLARKHAGIVAPLPIPTQLHVDWHDLLPHITTQGEFMQVIRSGFMKDCGLEQWARRTMLSRGDPIRNLANYVYRLLDGGIISPPFLLQSEVQSWFKMIPPAWMWSYYRRIKDLIRHPVMLGMDPEYAKEYVPRNEIHSRIQKWADLLASKPARNEE